jgi:hypothetical protein
VEMKNFKTVAAVIGGIVLSAGGFQMLHAQSAPAAYTVSEIKVSDTDAYKQWLPDVQKGILDAGGEYVAGGFDKATGFMGAPPANRHSGFIYRWYRDDRPDRPQHDRLGHEYPKYVKWN